MKNFPKVISGNPLSASRLAELEKSGRTIAADESHDPSDVIFSQVRYARYMCGIIVKEGAPAIVAAASAKFTKTIMDNVDLQSPDPFQVIPAQIVVDGYAAIAEKAPDIAGIQPLRQKIEPFYRRAQQSGGFVRNQGPIA